MVRYRSSFELEVPTSSAREICSKVLRDLGWGVSGEGDRRLVGTEDLAKLCCRESPIRVEIELVPSSEQTTQIVIDGSIQGPGWGLIAPKRLREQLPALERRILRRDQPVASQDSKL